MLMVIEDTNTVGRPQKEFAISTKFSKRCKNSVEKGYRY